MLYPIPVRDAQGRESFPDAVFADVFLTPAQKIKLLQMCADDPQQVARIAALGREIDRQEAASRTANRLLNRDRE